MAHHLGYCDKNITVHMPGGQLSIDIKNPSNVFLGGPVEYIYSGDIENS